MLALIPAAGNSTRMGRPKLALPLGDRTVLEHVVSALRRAGVDSVVVVVGPHVPELGSLAEGAGAAVCPLDRATPDMRATVEEGLSWVEERFHPAPGDGWLLVPADHPALEPAAVRAMIAAWEDRQGCSVIIPTYEGKRGHPALIDWKHVAALRGLPAGQGINTYLRHCAAETLELPVASAAVLCDLDVPADYERLSREWPKAV